jgi:hypothetical protein
MICKTPSQIEGVSLNLGRTVLGLGRQARIARADLAGRSTQAQVKFGLLGGFWEGVRSHHIWPSPAGFGGTGALASILGCTAPDLSRWLCRCRRRPPQNRRRRLVRVITNQLVDLRSKNNVGMGRVSGGEPVASAKCGRLGGVSLVKKMLSVSCRTLFSDGIAVWKICCHRHIASSTKPHVLAKSAPSKNRRLARHRPNIKHKCTKGNGPNFSPARVPKPGCDLLDLGQLVGDPSSYCVVVTRHCRPP